MALKENMKVHTSFFPRLLNLKHMTIMLSYETQVLPQKAAGDNEAAQGLPFFLHHLTMGLTGRHTSQGRGPAAVERQHRWSLQSQ